MTEQKSANNSQESESDIKKFLIDSTYLEPGYESAGYRILSNSMLQALESREVSILNRDFINKVMVLGMVWDLGELKKTFENINNDSDIDKIFARATGVLCHGLVHRINYYLKFFNSLKKEGKNFNSDEIRLIELCSKISNIYALISSMSGRYEPGYSLGLMQNLSKIGKIPPFPDVEEQFVIEVKEKVGELGGPLRGDSKEYYDWLGKEYLGLIKLGEENFPGIDFGKEMVDLRVWITNNVQ